MKALRRQLSARLRAIGVEESPWPGRDGFASLSYLGQEFAHFHSDSEIDIRLGKEVILRERLVHPSSSTVHPDRSKNSPWYEMKVTVLADVEKAMRLVELAIRGIQDKRK